MATPPGKIKLIKIDKVPFPKIDLRPIPPTPTPAHPRQTQLSLGIPPLFYRCMDNIGSELDVKLHVI